MAFRQFRGFQFCLYLWNTWQIRKSERVLWIRDEWLLFSCELCQLTKSEAQLHFWHRVIVSKSSKHISCNSLPLGCLCGCACMWTSLMLSFIYHTLTYWHLGKKTWIIEGILPSNCDPATISLSVSSLCLLACNLMRVPDVGRWSSSNPSF